MHLGVLGYNRACCYRGVTASAGAVACIVARACVIATLVAAGVIICGGSGDGSYYSVGIYRLDGESRDLCFLVLAAAYVIVV